eukprot:CAMPEP_0170173074 /NCGR_PEP_ID=MMETSP0040_2-20121228/6344_1 /TAXON_ID=641309 /ORGANISM="Lotharella oceanica, Strain CCMP622" /LENGTH=127 /DNA_ID=CAMNT_0010414071 /DNA_START=597 /DNA_END=981 /DNA_ORIENTATION=+
MWVSFSWRKLDWQLRPKMLDGADGQSKRDNDEEDGLRPCEDPDDELICMSEDMLRSLAGDFLSLPRDRRSSLEAGPLALPWSEDDLAPKRSSQPDRSSASTTDSIFVWDDISSKTERGNSWCRRSSW